MPQQLRPQNKFTTMGIFNRKKKEAQIEANGTNYDQGQDTKIAGIITQGAGTPAAKPTAKNLLYFNTTTQKLYVSVGTSSTSDWKEVLAADPA